jgi:hypothetical protein
VVAAIVNSVEMDDDASRKLWLIADECPQMGRAPLRPLLDLGRSRGFRCVLACQDLAQLEEVHGQHAAKAMASMVGALIVGQIMQGDTAEQLCKAMGTMEVERANVSTSLGGGGATGKSTTLSFSRDELAIYKPSELGSRLGPTPDGKGVKMALFTGGNAYELFWPHFPMPQRRAAHQAAAWTRRFGTPTAVLSAAPAWAASQASFRPLADNGVADQPLDGERWRESANQGSEPTFGSVGQGMPTTEEIESMLRRSVEVTSLDAPVRADDA